MSLISSKSEGNYSKELSKIYQYDWFIYLANGVQETQQLSEHLLLLMHFSRSKMLIG